MMLAELEFESHPPLSQRVAERITDFIGNPQAQLESMLTVTDRISGKFHEYLGRDEQGVLCERSEWAPATILQATAKIKRILGNGDLAYAIWCDDQRAVPLDFQPPHGNPNELRTFGLRWVNDGTHRASLNATLDARQVRPDVAVGTIISRLNRHNKIAFGTSVPHDAPKPKPQELYNHGKPTTGNLMLREVVFEQTDRPGVFRAKIPYTQLSLEVTLHRDRKNKPTHLNPGMHRGRFDLSVIVEDTHDGTFSRMLEQTLKELNGSKQSDRKTVRGDPPPEDITAIAKQRELTEWKKRLHYSGLMRILEDGDCNAVEPHAEEKFTMTEHTPQEMVDLFIKSYGRDYTQQVTPETEEKPNISTMVFAQKYGGYQVLLAWDTDDRWLTIRVTPSTFLQKARRNKVMTDLRNLFPSRIHDLLKAHSAQDPLVWRNPDAATDCSGFHIGRRVGGKLREFTDTDVATIASELFNPPKMLLQAADDYAHGDPVGDTAWGSELVIQGKQTHTETVLWKIEPGTDTMGKRRAKIVCYLLQPIDRKKTPPNRKK